MLLQIIIAALATVSATTTTAAQRGPAPTVDWAHAQQAHVLLERWIAKGQVPENPVADDLWVNGVVGIRVTLRWFGRTMGRGDVANTPLEAPPPLDLANATRTACSKAVQEVVRALRQRQQDTADDEGNPTLKNGNMLDLTRIGPALLADLQIGWKPEPIVLAKKANTDDLVNAYSPGHHGLAAYRRAQTGANASWIWPATAMAMNLRPSGQVRALLSRLSRSHGRIDNPAACIATRFIRFHVIHYVRPASHQPRTRLIRGNIPLPPRAITGTDLETVTAMLSEHLLKRIRKDGSFAGTYHPTTSRFDPQTASPGEAALTTYALARRLHHMYPTRQSIAPEPAGYAALRESIALALHHLAPTLADERVAMDPSAASLVVLALSRMARMPDAKAHRDRIVSRLLSLQADDGMFRFAPTDAARHVQPVTQSLVLMALESCYHQTRNANLLPAITRGRRALWNIVDRNMLLSTLPWSAMIMFSDVVPHGNDDTPSLADDAHLEDFIALDQSLARMQITDLTSINPRDVFGGYDLEGRTTQWPSADWRTSALLAYTALRLRHAPPASGPHRRNALLACGRAARFVAQLMIDEPSCYYGLDHDTMIGGVRSTLWDNRLPLDRTAMALLALTELQESLVHLAGSPLTDREPSTDTVP